MEIIFWSIVYFIGYSVAFVLTYRTMELPRNRYLSGSEKVFSYSVICGLWPITFPMLGTALILHRVLRRFSF